MCNYNDTFIPLVVFGMFSIQINIVTYVSVIK